MALRKKIPDQLANYPLPVKGVNLLASPEDLEMEEAAMMTNCYTWNGVVSRTGSSRVNGTTLGAYRIRGGVKFYYTASSKVRLIAYSTNIATLSDAGSAVNLTTGLTSDLDTFFQPWQQTAKVYITNGTDAMYEYDGTTFQAVTANVGSTAVPVGATVVKPILDRLMCIASTGNIERSNPRVGHIWSTASSWATIRPSLEGPFKALHPHTIRSVLGDLTAGLIACQATATYFISGTSFGADVTAATAPTGENSSVQLIDPRYGTASPYSLCTVPGVGTFGFSADLNVWLLPQGAASIIVLGDRIRSTGAVNGIENVNLNALNQVWMTYWDRKLILGVPTGNNTYCDTYFWMDMKSWVLNPERGPVWYGPHSGFYVNRVWPESQQGENTLYAGEGNSANGAFVYKLLQDGRYTDAVGSADTNITFDYQTTYHDFGTPSQEKYVQTIQVDANTFTGTPTVSLYDIGGTVATGLTLTAI